MSPKVVPIPVTTAYDDGISKQETTPRRSFREKLSSIGKGSTMPSVLRPAQADQGTDEACGGKDIAPLRSNIELRSAEGTWISRSGLASASPLLDGRLPSANNPTTSLNYGDQSGKTHLPSIRDRVAPDPSSSPSILPWPTTAHGPPMVRAAPASPSGAAATLAQANHSEEGGGSTAPDALSQAGARENLHDSKKDLQGDSVYGEGNAGGRSGDNPVGPRFHLKTVASTPFLLTRMTSYADVHGQDVFAETNSLSKVVTEEDEVKEPMFLLHHECFEKLAWDTFMMALIVFSAFINPLQIAFDRDPTGALWAFEVLIDFIFMVDVGLSFRTTVMDSATKETIRDVQEISKRYIRGWFVLDGLSSLPVALLLHTVPHDYRKYFYMLKMLRTIKLWRLSEITNAVLKMFEDRDFNPATFRVYMFMLVFIIVLHFIACGYWMVSRVTDPDFSGHWTPEEEYLEDELYIEYSRSVYFALAILYGNDLKPENNIEYAFSNMCLLLAQLTNAIIIGSVSNLLANMDAGAVSKKKQMDGIGLFMRVRKVPKSLQKRIRTYYEHLWHSGHDSHSSALFEELPHKLKLQLNIALKRALIDQVPIFKTLTPAGTIALVQNLITSIILPGELIVRQGELATCMFFISSGTVRVSLSLESENGDGSPPEEIYVISLGAGSFFGEVALLREVHQRTATVRAETFTELQVMHSKDFHALAEVFPEFETAVKMISASRVKTGEAVGQATKRAKTRWSKTVRAVKTVNQFKVKQSASRWKRDCMSVPRWMITFRKSIAERIKRQAREGPSPASPRNAQLLREQDSRRDLRIKTVYDTVIDHEELVSHEAAIRVGKGGGIAREDLVAMHRV